MSGSTAALWLTLAVLLFWSLGAYNRLVRLRAHVIACFSAVDQRMGQALGLLAQVVAAHENLGATATGRAGATDVSDGTSAARDGLQAAALQLEVALRVARRQALDASAVAALQAAYTTAQVVWERYRAPAAEPDSATLQRAWEDNIQVVREAEAGYNIAVQDYNAAIAQFPASVLASIFGFRPASSL